MHLFLKCKNTLVWKLKITYIFVIVVVIVIHGYGLKSDVWKEDDVCYIIESSGNVDGEIIGC